MISPKNIIYYLGENDISLDSDIGLLKISERHQQLFEFFNSINKKILNELI